MFYETYLRWVNWKFDGCSFTIIKLFSVYVFDNNGIKSCNYHRCIDHK